MKAIITGTFAASFLALASASVATAQGNATIDRDGWPVSDSAATLEKALKACELVLIEFGDGEGQSAYTYGKWATQIFDGLNPAPAYARSADKLDFKLKGGYTLPPQVSLKLASFERATIGGQQGYIVGVAGEASYGDVIGLYDFRAQWSNSRVSLGTVRFFAPDDVLAGRVQVDIDSYGALDGKLFNVSGTIRTLQGKGFDGLPAASWGLGSELGVSACKAL